MGLLVASLALALAISFCCSIAEAVLLSLTPAQLASLRERDPRSGELWMNLRHPVERTIATILVLNTTAHTIGAAVAGAQVQRLYGQVWVSLFSVVFTFVMLQYTEILPKTIGVRHNEAIARRIGTPLRWTVAALTPLVLLVRWLNRPFEGRRAPGPPGGIEEIAALAGLARLSEEIGAQQERIITTASRLAEQKASEAMISASEISFLDGGLTLGAALAAAHVDAHTRFPVRASGEPLRVTGYVNFKELAYAARSSPPDSALARFVHPVLFVHPETPVSEILRFFVDEHEHMAVVRAANGDVRGLITLEDIIEIMVGEIEDEFDRMPHYLHEMADGTWMAGGGTPIPVVNARLCLSLPEPKGTLSAWIERSLGRPPRAGDTVAEGGREFVVRRTRRGRVFEAAIHGISPSCPGLRPPLVRDEADALHGAGRDGASSDAAGP